MHSLSINGSEKRIRFSRNKVHLKVIPGGRLKKEQRYKKFLRLCLLWSLYLLFLIILFAIFYLYINALKIV